MTRAIFVAPSSNLVDRADTLAALRLPPATPLLVGSSPPPTTKKNGRRRSYSIAAYAVYKYSYKMHVFVTPLRRNGFRIPARDLGSSEISGDLVIQERAISPTQARKAAEVRTHGSQLASGDQLLAVLFDPEIRCWHGATFKLNGWEVIDWKGEGRQLVVQEWACRIEGF